MTISRKLIAVMLGAAVMGSAASSAMASLVPVGDPLPSHSWAQGFNETGVGNFDFLAVSSVSGADFEPPVFSSFSSAGWSLSNNGLATVATAARLSPVTNENFTVTFHGLSSSPLSFNFYAYEGSLLKESALATWNGGTWSFSAASVPLSGTDLEQRAVPLPASAGVGLSMLVGFGALFGVRKQLSRRARIA